MRGRSGVVGDSPVKLDNLVHQTPSLPDRFLRSLVLPEFPTTFPTTSDSIHHLFDSLRSYLAVAECLSRSDQQILASWALATWFAEFLPAFPPLLLIGETASAQGLLQTIRGICRLPVLLADVTAGTYSTLPMHLTPTLLVLRPSVRGASLLAMGTARDYYLCSSGEPRTIYGPKLVYTNDEKCIQALSNDSVRISLPPGNFAADTSEARRNHIVDLQTRLLACRWDYAESVAAAKVTLQVPPDLRAKADPIARVFAGDQSLIADLIAALTENHEKQQRCQSIDPAIIVIEALLRLIHSGDGRAYVREISEVVNFIYQERNEQRDVTPEATGYILKKLGL